MHHFVSGAAGFIGSQLVDRLLDGGNKVSGADDLSLGKLEHLDGARQNPDFCLFEEDISQADCAIECLRAASDWSGSPDMVWHLAANSDIAARCRRCLCRF